MLKYHILEKKTPYRRPCNLHFGFWLARVVPILFYDTWRLAKPFEVSCMALPLLLCWCFWGNGANGNWGGGGGGYKMSWLATFSVIVRFPSTLFSYIYFAPGMHGGFIRFAFSCIDKKVLFNSPTPGYMYTERKKGQRTKEYGIKGPMWLISIMNRIGVLGYEE